MKKFAYLIVREDLNAPLVQSQCIDVISSVNKTWANGRVELVWFYRIDYIFRKNHASLSDLRKRLSGFGIKTHFIPFISLGFPLQWWALPFTLPQWIVGLLYLRYFLDFRHYHCRSYHAGLLARIGESLFDCRYIFDPRSPFPEENVLAKNWDPDSLSRNLWKRLETWIVNGASTTVVVSRALTSLYEDVDSVSRFSLIPNNYPDSFETYIENNAPADEKKYTLAYVGSFGNWNRPGPYLQLLARLNEDGMGRVNMLFIVRTESRSELSIQADRLGINRSLFDIVTIKQEEVPIWLDKCVFGVYLMNGKDPRLGVKTVEYLALGLPLIVSENIIGAAELVHNEGLGVTWDHSDFDSMRVASWMRNAYKEQDRWAISCRRYAREHLSCQGVALKLISAYEAVHRG